MEQIVLDVVREHTAGSPQHDGALVEKMGGQVHVLPAERMPSGTGVAASFRH